MGITTDKILSIVASRMGYNISQNPLNDTLWWFISKDQKERISIHFKGDSHCSISDNEKEILDMIQIVYQELWKEYCGDE